MPCATALHLLHTTALHVLLLFIEPRSELRPVAECYWYGWGSTFKIWHHKRQNKIDLGIVPHTGNPSTERLRKESCHEFVAGMGYTKFQGNLSYLVRPSEFCNSLQATDILCIILLFVWRSSQTSKKDGFSSVLQEKDHTHQYLKTLTLWRTAAPWSQATECHHID